MQTKYKTLLWIGTGILIIGTTIYLLSSKQSRDNIRATKSIDMAVEEQSDLQPAFGDMPYIPKRA